LERWSTTALPGGWGTIRAPTAERDGRQTPVWQGTAGFLKKPAVGGGPTPPRPAKKQSGWLAGLVWSVRDAKGIEGLTID